MSKVKMIAAVLIAAFALSALVSASASAAAGWMVNGTLLSGSAALASTAAVEKPGTLTAAGVTIECTSSTLHSIESEIKSPNTNAIRSVEYSGCSSVTASCALAGGTGVIATLPFTGEVTLSGSSGVVDTFTPKTKSLFATIGYEGEICALKGVQPVTGKAKILAPTGQEERTVQQASSLVTEASGELKVGSAPASIVGTVLSKLASGLPWSFL